MRVQFSQGPYRTKGTARAGDSTVSRGLVVHFWPLRLVVRTRGFHPRNSSSILLVANGECSHIPLPTIGTDDKELTIGSDDREYIGQVLNGETAAC